MTTGPQSPQYTLTFYAFDVREDADPGTRIGQVIAAVPAVGWTGPAVKYAVTSLWSESVFSVDPVTGVVTLSGTLNFELV